MTMSHYDSLAAQNNPVRQPVARSTYDSLAQQNNPVQVGYAAEVDAKAKAWYDQYGH